MYQEAVRRLCHPSESRHVRKVAHLLAQALYYRGIEWGFGWAFIRDANGQNAFSNLSRYETAIERGLYKPSMNSSACRPTVPPPAASRRLWQWTSSTP